MCSNTFEQFWQGSLLRLGWGAKVVKVKGRRGKEVIIPHTEKCKIDVVLCAPGNNLMEYDGTEVWVDFARKI